MEEYPSPEIKTKMMTDLRGVTLEVGQKVVVVTNRHGKFATFEANILAIGKEKVTVDSGRWSDKSSVLPNHIAVL